MNKEALLIVDPQKCFMPGGSLAVKDGDQIVEPINRMIDFANEHSWRVYVSRDWHLQNSRHFSANGGIWPEHGVVNSEGAKFHPSLNLNRAIILSKGMEIEEDGYSSFEAEDDEGRDLDDLLKKVGIVTIYIGGLATDYCVKASALDAARLGYKTILLQDACRAVNLDPKDEEKAIQEMVSAGVKISSTGNVLEGLVNGS